jgi:hypothetical protein
MKSFCKNCESLQPSSFRLEHNAETRKPYEDLCCNTCHFVVATVQGREALAQPAQDVDYWIREATAARQAEIAMRRELEAQPAQEPVAWADLLKEAQQIVESKFLWKKFIDGTPLANDIAFWMVDFAQQYTTPPKREWIGLTEEEIDAIYWQHENHCGEYKVSIWPYERDIEQALKEKNT